MATPNLSFGNVPSLPPARAPGGVASDVGTAAQGFVRGLMALRQQAAERAFRKAQLQMRRTQEERLRSQGQQRIELGEQQLEATQANRTAQRDLRREMAEFQADLEEKLAEEEREFEERMTRLQLGAEERAAGRGEAEDRAENQRRTLMLDAKAALRAGADPEQVLERGMALVGKEGPLSALDEDDVRAAVAEARDEVQSERTQLESLLERLGQGESGGEGREAPPRRGGLLLGGPEDQEPSAPSPAELSTIVRQAQQAVEAGRAEPEKVVNDVRQRWGDEVAEVVRQELEGQSESTGPSVSAPSLPGSVSPEILQQILQRVFRQVAEGS